MFASLHHVAIICSNYASSKHFYTQVLGLVPINETFRAERNSYKLDLAIPGAASASGAPLQIELFSFPNPPSRVSRPEACGLRHLAFNVPDLDAAVKRLKDSGIAVEDIRVDPITAKRFTFFADPDDLPIELYEM